MSRHVEKPWGRAVLPPPFPQHGQGQRIGEIWFEPSEKLPELLVKYIFTSEQLSVQVHPSDAQTQQMGLGRQGKEECWLVIDAAPDAVLGVGFEPNLTAFDLRSAALDGSIEDYLAWHPVQPGDFFYIPANTVHAIGAGISLIEIQQASDITYRLYDYGRPRQLHIEEAIPVAQVAPHPSHLRRRLPRQGAASLASGPYFRIDRVAGPPSWDIAGRYLSALLVIPLDCEVSIAGEVIAMGQCGLAEHVSSICVPANGHCLFAQPTEPALQKASQFGFSKSLEVACWPADAVK